MANCNNNNNCKSLSGQGFGMTGGNQGITTYSGSFTTVPATPINHTLADGIYQSIRTVGAPNKGALSPFKKAKLKRLQITYDPTFTTAVQLKITRTIGSKSETNSIPLDSFNTMNAYQTGKITIECADLVLYATDRFSLTGTAGEIDTITFVAEWEYEL